MVHNNIDYRLLVMLPAQAYLSSRPVNKGERSEC